MLDFLYPFTEVKRATDLGWDFWPSQLQFYPGAYVTTLINFVDMSCVNIHSWAWLERSEETANSFTKDDDRREIELSWNSAYEHKNVTDIDGIWQSLAVWRVHLSPFACNFLDGITVLPFF